MLLPLFIFGLLIAVKGSRKRVVSSLETVYVDSYGPKPYFHIDEEAEENDDEKMIVSEPRVIEKTTIIEKQPIIIEKKEAPRVSKLRRERIVVEREEVEIMAPPPQPIIVNRERLLDGVQNMGRNIRVKPGEAKSVLNIVGEDNLAEVITFTLSVQPKDTSAPVSSIARPTAIVQWGNGGVQVEAEMDYVHGLTMSIPASFLRITGRNDVLPATIRGNPAVARDATLGAFIAYGNRSSFPAQKTVYLDDPALFPIVVSVPDFSSTLSVERAPGTAVFTIDYLDEMGNTISSIRISANEVMENATMPSDTKSIRYTSPSSAIARLVFKLAI